MTAQLIQGNSMTANKPSSMEILEKISRMRVSAISEDQVVRMTKSRNRLDVELHPVKYPSISTKVLQSDIATTFISVLRAHNSATQNVLASRRGDEPPPPPSPREKLRNKLMQEAREHIHVRVSSGNGYVHAGWAQLGKVRVVLDSIPNEQYRVDFEQEIASTLTELTNEYRRAIRKNMDEIATIIHQRTGDNNEWR